MKKEKPLSELSQEELQQKLKLSTTMAILMSVFVVILFGIHLWLSSKGNRSMMVLPFSMIPLLILFFSKMDKIKKELKNRS